MAILSTQRDQELRSMQRIPPSFEADEVVEAEQSLISAAPVDMVRLGPGPATAPGHGLPAPAAFRAAWEDTPDSQSDHARCSAVTVADPYVTGVRASCVQRKTKSFRSGLVRVSVWSMVARTRA